MDKKDNNSNVVQFFVIPFVIFTIIGLGFFYTLLITPLYCYVFTALIAYFVYKLASYFGLAHIGSGSNPDLEDAIFIKGHTSVSVCIVGAGFSGICMAIKLKQAGLKFKVFEKGPELGGTWWANRYPGCRCDVWSVLYQLSFYLNPNWTTWVAPSDEIRAYMHQAAAHFGIQEDITYNTKVELAEWDHTTSSWRVETDSGQVLHVTHLVSGCGALRRPLFPDIPGLKEFKGTQFHSSQWDQDFDLNNKRVAIIGSGASAIQIAPAIVDQVKELYVFQRTPNWFFPRLESNFAPWFTKMLKTIPWLMTVQYWFFFCLVELNAFMWLRKGTISKYYEKWLTGNMSQQLNNDQTLVEKMIPKYEIGCKRILLSNDFLPMFVQKANAHLITDSIREVTEHGICTETCNSYEVDLIVFATGFHIEDSICGFKTTGQNGTLLRDHFDTNPAAYLGITVPEFPNFFLLLGPNTVLAHNSVLFMIECQVNYVMDCIRQMIDCNIDSLVVKDSVTAKFRQAMDVQSLTRNFTGNCKGWYKNKDGINFILWPSNLFHYWWDTRKAELLRDFWIRFRK